MGTAHASLSIDRGAPVEVLRRVIGAAGAGADLPVDRVEDGLLLGELLAKWVASADQRLRVDVVGAERLLEVVVGPLSDAAHADLVAALELDADDSPTAAIVDAVRRDGTGNERRLTLTISETPVSDGADRAIPGDSPNTREQMLDDGTTVEPRDGSVSIRLPATPESLPVVRQALTGAAEDLRLRADLLDDVKIAVSEACNNAVVHAYPDGSAGALEVEIWTEPRRLLVEVRDWGAGMAPRSVQTETGLGLGLSLMASLAEEVTLGRGGGDATVVRLGFALDPRD
jgi:serine/threonine-protein kinase RsbW